MTPQQIKNLHDLLAAQVRSGLVEGDEYRARRKELYRLAHEAEKQTQPVEKHEPDTSWYPQEVTA